MLLFIILSFIAAVYLVATGFRDAVKKSEIRLRAKYDAEGSSSADSRELMCKAGYNVWGLGSR